MVIVTVVIMNLGTGPRNTVKYNPQGGVICLAGFGNLRGEMVRGMVSARFFPAFIAEMSACSGNMVISFLSRLFELYPDLPPNFRPCFTAVESKDVPYEQSYVLYFINMHFSLVNVLNLVKEHRLFGYRVKTVSSCCHCRAGVLGPQASAAGEQDAGPRHDLLGMVPGRRTFPDIHAVPALTVRRACFCLL
jgi:hypothetical protein